MNTFRNVSPKKDTSFTEKPFRKKEKKETLLAKSKKREEKYPSFPLKKKKESLPFPRFLARGRLLSVSVTLPKRNLEILLSRFSAKKIPVLGLKMGENTVKVKVRAQDYPLAIAIFRRMCYTVSNPCVSGLLAPVVWGIRRMGVTVGVLLFFALSVLARPLVVTVEYRGSAAFRKEEMQAVLESSGVSAFRPADMQTLQRAERDLLTAFPSLWFVSLEKRGFYLTVTAESTPVKVETEKTYLLSAPTDGVVQSITVLQGIPLVTLGESVTKGQPLVRGGIFSGVGEDLTETKAPVIAEIVILCAYRQEYFYASENEHLLQLLKHNAISLVGGEPQADESRIEKTENGYRYLVEFSYSATLIGGNPWKQKSEE
ncbi:MAG: hypothetical protein E7363_03685 [Clostridiales bacterium]|nr:hypothetical protein [Clostridiales bacterium]